MRPPRKQPIRHTYTPQQFAEARAAWDAGRFSAEWRDWRHLAAMEAGIIWPPDGDAYDSWSDDSPSQRAILVRAMRETPAMLRDAIRRAPRPSWGAVIEVLLRGRDRMAADLDERQREAELARRYEATPSQATVALKHVLDVIGQS